MMAKAAGLPADEVFLDLEDAVAPGAKEEARRLVVRALLDNDWSTAHVGVRVNAVSTPHCYRDLVEVVEGAGDRLEFVVLPKAERAADVTFVADLLRQIEDAAGLPRRISIEVQIESAAGLANVDAIFRASERLTAGIFGPADMGVSLGMPILTAGRPPPAYPGDPFHHAMSVILVAARAAGLQAIDGPHLVIEDLEGCRAMAQRARALGYDGKWAVHPSQLAVLNEAFSPTQQEYDRAEAILEAYARATAGGRGAVRFGEEMIDEANRKLAERLAARGRAAGMARSPAGGGGDRSE